MSVLDRFLNVMKLNDEDEFDGEEYLDEPDIEAEETDRRVKRRIIRDREDDLFDDTETDERTSSQTSSKSTSRGSSSSKKKESIPAKVTQIRSRRRNSDNGMEVCVIRPHTMEDAREITETLLANCTVVLNLENLELDIAQRIIDFASGSCYAIDGNLQKISSYIFIITPSTVDISGDFQEILSGAFDVPFESRY